MILNVNPDNPEGRKISQIVKILEKGGVIIYPTDTVYALACLANNKEGISRIHRIKQSNPQKNLMTIMCTDISETSKLTKPIPNDVFKLMKRNIPGPYTFILNANSKVPKMVQSRRKTIGFRIPQNPIALEILANISDYLVSTSLKIEEENGEEKYYPDPVDIGDRFDKVVDLVVDGGILETTLSSVIDCTTEQPEVIREGEEPII